MSQTTTASPRKPRASARREAFSGGRLAHLSPAGETTRASLLRAAAEVFAEKGFAEASIDDVARRLGATKGLVYHHYRSKGDLYLDTAAWGIDFMARAVAQAAASRERAATRLKQMAEAHLAALIAEPAARHGRREPPPSVIQRDFAAEAEHLAAKAGDYESGFATVLETTRREGDADATTDGAVALRVLFAVLDIPAHDRATDMGAAQRSALAQAALRAACLDPVVLGEEFS